ncbi:MAG: DUF1127 domain-containing protein [SAR324 cluster bacterium]|nr:DUF1127 domain-containing protein [SAR324 cluster bacterium]
MKVNILPISSANIIEQISPGQKFIVHIKAGRQLIRKWIKRSIERRVLKELNGYVLKDIGITRLEANREADKWFWQD